jgi:CheY-like chemotaxis protein
MSHKYSIFVAEDNAEDVFLVREALVEAGLDFELRVFDDDASGTALLDRIGKDVPCPDILLMDLNLPKTDGIDLIRMLKAHPKCLDTPVVVITSSSSPKDRERATAAGAKHYFVKPMSLAEYLKLGELVRTVLETETKG